MQHAIAATIGTAANNASDRFQTHGTIKELLAPAYHSMQANEQDWSNRELRAVIVPSNINSNSKGGVVFPLQASGQM